MDGEAIRVQNELGIARANTLHDIDIMVEQHRWAAGQRISYMDVDDRGAGVSCTQASVGNLFRRYGQMRRLFGRRQITGYRTSDDDLLAWRAHGGFLVERADSIDHDGRSMANPGGVA